MSILERLTGAAAVAALALSSVSVAAPAQAAPGDATLTFAPTVVLAPESCVDHAFTYAVELPEGTTSWQLTIELLDASGANHHRESFGTLNQTPPSGSGAIQLCSVHEPAGTYSIATTVDYTVGTSATVFGTKQVAGTVDVVGRATTKVSLKAKRTGAEVTATAKVGVTTGGTTEAIGAGNKVTFLKKVGKRWKALRKGSTNAAGVAKARFRAKKGDTIRAVFYGAGDVLVGGSTTPVPPGSSKPVRVT
ncbi:hypothetical protein [Nocardioides hwasunensis]|uniref:Uncharacterized protein n=1 Tax=Nocardioides hwasunensis TaxID=397258 RepID=A0ABR8MQ03_9ACTN|nr:hypothetical protein [Nocardioides hwasunensis]MBD3916174.1 hypothetical protein [Nocardioides hwasunensis]